MQWLFVFKTLVGFFVVVVLESWGALGKGIIRQQIRLKSDPQWQPGIATWYGDPEGNGSDGGACGYTSMVKPLKARVGAVNSKLFKKGKGCGACYKVKCLEKSICAKRAVTMIVTDECPGCSEGHFDLSGATFGRMAIGGKGGKLRDKGKLPIVYRRTSCKYPGKNIGFRVNEGSSEYWLSLLVKYVDDDGDIGSMKIKQAGGEWQEMKHQWGANWFISGEPMEGPFSVKLTSLTTEKTLTAKDVIPKDWACKATYPSHLRFFS